MAKVIVHTTPKGGLDLDSVTRKETDLDLPGNRRWLMSHLRWAAKFGAAVSIYPIF